MWGFSLADQICISCQLSTQVVVFKEREWGRAALEEIKTSIDGLRDSACLYPHRSRVSG